MGYKKVNILKKNKTALTNFLSPIEILPFNQKAALEYAKIRTILEKKGEIIGAYDLMIGAHALAENLTLVTNNVNEFKRINKLTIENWAE